MKPIGTVTRGTTNPNRLRRVDVWIAWRYQSLLRTTAVPLVVDLGYGATPITTHELALRLNAVSPQVSVIGLEIARERVDLARKTETNRVHFQFGGFEIPTVRSPILIRALNVLRQYPESEVQSHWETMQRRLATGGFLIEGTCDELGRRAAWIELDQHGPRSLTLASQLRDLRQPSDLAPRLPKALIHRNVDGEPIHRFLQAMDRAWHHQAAFSVYGPRQQWAAMINQLRNDWPVITPVSRERHGEITVDWRALTSADVAHP